MFRSSGIHHITAISSDPRRTVTFYTQALGLRLVKRTINFDDPFSWHVYFGDERGSPGTALTFFGRSLPPGRNGPGMVVSIAFAVPQHSLSYWTHRLAERGIPAHRVESRAGNATLTFRDPDGLQAELVATDEVENGATWTIGEIPKEHAIRGFYGAGLCARDMQPTKDILVDALGFEIVEFDQKSFRLRSPGSRLANFISIEVAQEPNAGAMGAGSIHHIAFRASNEQAQIYMAERARIRGLNPTEQIDRCYFRSVYFREPSGILFEIATDQPGFTVDEPLEKLGSAIMLPKWYEPRRAEIEGALTPLAQ